MVTIPDKFVGGETPSAGALKPGPTPQGMTNSPAMTGAGVVQGAAAQGGEGFDQFVQTMNGIAANMQKRTETVERAKAYGQFQSEAQSELLRLQTEGDLSDTRVAQQYGKFLSDKINTYVSGHQGGGDSKAMLATRLEDTRTHFASQAGEIGVVIGQKKVAGVLDGQLSSITNEVSANPALLASSLQKWESNMADMAPALDPTREDSINKAAKSQIVMSAMNGFFASGDTQTIRGILTQNPGLREMLNPEQQRTLDTKLITLEHQKEQAANAGQRRVDEWVQIMGYQPSELQRLQIAGMSVSTRQTFAEKVAEIESVLKVKLTPDQLARMANISSSSEHVFGAGEGGLSKEILARDTPAFAEGLLSPEKERQYQFALQTYLNPPSRQNPVTGVWERQEPQQLPKFVADALEKRGMVVPGAGTGGQTPYDILADYPELFAGGKTIFDMGDLYTGPLSAAKQTIGATPFLGTGAGEIDSAKSTVRIAFRRLVTALLQNPKFAEGERESVSDDLSIESKIWDNSIAFMNRMVGIDRALEGYAKDAERALVGATSVATKQHQLDTLGTINAFRSKLMPQRIESDDLVKEFMKKNKPGTPFVAKDENGYWARWAVPSNKDSKQ